MNIVSFDAEKDREERSRDGFGPVTPNTLALPPHFQVHFIGDESACELLLDLVGKPVIGLDAEWRPNLTKFLKTHPAIL